MADLAKYEELDDADVYKRQGMAAPAFAFEGEAAPVEQPVLPEVVEDIVTCLLYTSLLREFVEKIVVHECSYDENKTRRQDIEIYYSFVGKVDLPCLLYTSFPCTFPLVSSFALTSTYP